MNNKMLTVIIIALVALGGLYAWRTSSCIKSISYTSAREGTPAPVRNLSGLQRTAQDKGDYYIFKTGKYKTMNDAMRACMWSW